MLARHSPELNAKQQASFSVREGAKVTIMGQVRVLAVRRPWRGGVPTVGPTGRRAGDGGGGGGGD